MTQYAIEGEWLIEVVGHHTCGAGPGSYGGIHEPGCGTLPVAKVEDLLSESAKIAAVQTLLAERDALLMEEYPPPWATGTVHSALVTTAEVRALLEPSEDCCGHRAAEHGLRRCMALLDSGEPCPCTKGYKP